MEEKKILIVEDETEVSDILKFNLEKEGYRTAIAATGDDALKKNKNFNPDLILLDIMIPAPDGFDVCKEIRTYSNVPIIMLTARDGEVDRIFGLDIGADDYITKPFTMRELFARIRANIKRANNEFITTETETKNETEKDRLTIGDLEINYKKYEVLKRGEPIDVTLREYEVLKFLMENKDEVFSREKLLEKIWGYEYYGDVRTVDVTVRRLRKKIEDDDANPTFVQTKRGLGYYFSNDK